MNPENEHPGVPDLKLERFLLGELDPEEASWLQRELDKDPALQERVRQLRRSNDEILERYPASQVAVTVRKRLEESERSRTRVQKKSFNSGFWPVPALAAAAAAIVILLILPPPWQWFGGQSEIPVGTRIKGLEPQLLLFRKTETGSERLENGDMAREHDLILIQYLAAGKAYGAIFSLDGRGTLTRQAPLRGSEPMKLQQEGPVSLDFSYELDDAPRWEKFFFVTSDSLFDLDAVLDAARDSSRMTLEAPEDSLLLPARIHQTLITLEKGAGHE